MYNRYKVFTYYLYFALRCPIRAGGQGPGDGLEEENQNVEYWRSARCCPIIGCIIFLFYYNTNNKIGNFGKVHINFI